MASPTVDGSASSTAFTSSASGSVALTTASAGDLIVVCAQYSNHTGAQRSVSTVTSTGLTFALYKKYQPGVTNGVGLEVWTAVASSALSAATISVTLDGTANAGGIIAFGIAGLRSAAAPMDTNASIPATNNTSTGDLTMTYSTSQANDLIVFFGGGDSSTAFHGPSAAGWSSIKSVTNGGGTFENDGAFCSSLTQISPQSGATISTFGVASGTHELGILMAFTADGTGETGTGTLAFGGIGFSTAAKEQAAKTIFITSGTTFNVPADWNASNNSIEIIGAGGDGSAGVTAASNGSSGGSGGYSKAQNVSLTPGSTVNVQIGVHGGGDVSGNDTWIKNTASTVVCLAESGSSAVTSARGLGAGTGRAVGSAITAGTAGNNGAAVAGARGGPGGPGAPGPNGAGAASVATGGFVGASGGGGADGGSVGVVGTATTGGAGGANRNSTGAGAGATSTTAATAGTSGGGGGGGAPSNVNGAVGSQDTLWTQTSDSSTAGPGGGAGGGAGGSSVNAGNGGAPAGYGAGGAGGGESNPTGTSGLGGNGGPAIIVLKYVPAENATGALAFSGISFAGKGNDHTGRVALAFSGISFAGKGNDHTGRVALAFSGISFTARGVDNTAHGVLALSGIGIIAAGSDVVSPPSPLPAPVRLTATQRTDPLKWDVPIVNKTGLPTPEFMRKWQQQKSNNDAIVPQNYIDGQNSAALTAAKAYTVSYGATVLVAAQAYASSHLAPLPTKTVAALDASAPVGTMVLVTDAAAPSYLGALTGGGTVSTPAVKTSAGWVAF